MGPNSLLQLPQNTTCQLNKGWSIKSLRPNGEQSAVLGQAGNGALWCIPIPGGGGSTAAAAVAVTSPRDLYRVPTSGLVRRGSERVNEEDELGGVGEGGWVGWGGRGWVSWVGWERVGELGGVGEGG